MHEELPDPIDDPIEVARYILGEACNLIEDSVNKNNIDDFRQEFLSYWRLAVDTGNVSFYSLLEPQGPSRRIYVWRGQHHRIVGETPDALKQWLVRWGAEKGKIQEYTLHDAVLIWLPEPLIPIEYPQTAADVRNIVQKHSPEALEILEELVVMGTKEIDVIMGAHTANGACFAAVSLRPPTNTSTQKRRTDPLVKGFRLGHVPRELLISRFFSVSARAIKREVERADHLWIHGRDRDTRQGKIREARVAILGCGALGGSVARLLAQAGTGNLLLVDPAKLDWPNVSRHELDASSVGRYKAKELAVQIETSYPHLGQINWRHEKVGPSSRKLMRELASYDLVISTMGNWSAEGFLNEYQQGTNNFPPILYGWMEPHGVAAHAVLISRDDSCLRCGTDSTGRLILQVTDWPDDSDDLQGPACGAQFTPYGPSELCWAHALIAETAIEALTETSMRARHRIWIGHRDRIERDGGSWSSAWKTEMGDPGIGGLTAERVWVASDSCPVCARNGRAS